MTKAQSEVTRRNDVFSERASTRICQELPAENNPYAVEHSRCHGYELLDLVKKRSFADVLFLLFRGELPTSDESELLEALMVSFINPGPRHPATRSAMNAGIGKTDPALILPIALTTMSGKNNAAGAVEETMRFLRKQQRRQVSEVAVELIEKEVRPPEGDWIISPGFGSYYNSIDIQTAKIANYLAEFSAAGKALLWGQEFSETIALHDLGWLPVGVVAAVLTDLGFQPRAAAGIYQIISAPGLLAHGVEQSSKPLSAMPFLADEDYFIED